MACAVDEICQVTNSHSVTCAVHPCQLDVHDSTLQLACKYIDVGRRGGVRQCVTIGLIIKHDAACETLRFPGKHCFGKAHVCQCA
jgi:hypothetical protein